jgi:hypothetical protein
MLPVLNLVHSVDISLTPSEDCKSTPECTRKYNALMNMLGWSPIIKPEEIAPEQIAAPEFQFKWDGKSEQDSYVPLQEFLLRKLINSCVVGSGSGLPRGLLFNVDVYTLKPRLNITSNTLRETGQEPRLLFRLRGRTDLVVVTHADAPLVNANIKYFIEIKTVKDFKASISLREAILQLIGGNVGAQYHSPPVLLTNLVTHHYVLYVIQEKNPNDLLAYSLKVLKMTTLEQCLTFLESHTAQMRSVTRDFARMPTPRASIIGKLDVDELSNVAFVDTSVAAEEDADDEGEGTF